MIKLYEQVKYQEQIRDLLLEDKEWAFNIWVRWIFTEEDYTYWDYKIVCIEDEKIIWFCIWDSDSINRFSSISSLYIIPEYRWKWIASKLINNVIDYYKPLWFDIYHLVVWEDNKQAIKFYNKEWFIETWRNSIWYRINNKIKSKLFLTKTLC